MSPPSGRAPNHLPTNILPPHGSFCLIPGDEDPISSHDCGCRAPPRHSRPGGKGRLLRPRRKIQGHLPARCDGEHGLRRGQDHREGSPQRQSATIQIKGTVYAGGTPVPVAGKLRLKSNGKLKANSPLLGYYSPVATKPTRYKARNTSIKFKLVAQPGATLGDAPFTSQMTYTLKFRRDAVSIKGSGIVNDPPLPVSIKVQGDK